MKTLETIAREQQRRRPTYFDDPAKDRMVALVLELAEEVCVLRDALDTCGRLAEAGVPATDAAIAGFEVDEVLLDERLAGHEAFFTETLERLT